MFERTNSKRPVSFERIITISILLIFVFTSFQGISGSVFALSGQGNVERVTSIHENNSVQQDYYLQEWTQSTTSQFDSGENVDNTLNTESNEVKLDTERTVIGSAEETTDQRGGGLSGGTTTTTKTGDGEYQTDRGGWIDKFTIAVGQSTSDIELMALKPTGNVSEYWVDTPEGSTDRLSPDAEEVNDFDVDVPINKGDRIGIYTYGSLDAVAQREGANIYKYDGKIGDTPKTMDPGAEGEANAMEAEIVSYEKEGVIESSVHDCGETLDDWGTISWEADVPQDTNLTIETRTSPDETTWSAWEEAENGENVSSPLDRYIQYRATFESFEGSHTSVLDSITISYYTDESPPEIYHDELYDYQGEGPYEVTATIVANEGSAVNEDAVTLYYRKEDAIFWEEVSMEPTMDEHQFSGEIPDNDYSSGTDIYYYIEAEDQRKNSATDPRGAPEQYYSFTVDKVSPETELDPDGNEGEDDWYTSQVEVSFNTDNKGFSEVENTWYRINGETWKKYDGSFEITESGEYNFEFYSVDVVGNEEETQGEVLKIDNNKSITEYRIAPQGDVGENDWYLDDVMIELQITEQASGVDTTYYRINGEEWLEYSEPLFIEESGIYQIEFYSVDGAGNEEDIQKIEVKVDKEDPEMEHQLDGKSGEEGWYVSETELGLNAVDQISGVDTVYYKINDGNWSEYKEPLQLESGVYNVEYYAEDNSGRTSSERNLEIKVDTGSPELTVDLPETDGEWYTRSPDISTRVEDNWSGLDAVQYRCDPESDWQFLFEGSTNNTKKEYQRIIRCEERGELELEVRSIDIAGNEVNKVIPLKIDDSKPSLQEDSFSETVWNNDMEIRANFNNPPSGMNDVTLRYNTGDGWKEISMSRQNGEYVAIIPEDDVGFSSSVEYQVIAEDNAGNEMESEINQANIGVNWWYFSPIPVVVVLAGLFFYWKKNREEQEELIPMKESKISKIKRGKEEKLEEIEEEKKKTPAIEAVSDGETERCDICGGPIDSQNLLNCSCGNVYHDDCLRVEGNCPGCGEDYAAVTSYSEESFEKEETRLPSSSVEESMEPEPVEKETEEETPSPSSSEEETDELEPVEEKVEEETPPPSPEESNESKKDVEGVEVWADETSEESTEEVKEKVKKAERKVEKKKPEPPGESKEEKLERSGGKIECPVCGNKNDPGNEECWACRADLKEDGGEEESDE